MGNLKIFPPGICEGFIRTILPDTMLKVLRYGMSGYMRFVFIFQFKAGFVKQPGSGFLYDPDPEFFTVNTGPVKICQYRYSR